VSPDNPLFNNEIFGPVLSLTPIHSEGEAITLANQTSAGLAAYVYCKDTARGWLIADQLHCGMVGVNTTAISNASAPFGGVKESGFGREGGTQGLDEYLQLKTTTLNIG
jgi:succinate-semialdehyde dehydrogenase/glutarate-semialdehyde dehydrogenase